MAFFPIRSLQKALTEIRERGANISSPGPIDGIWGTQTERSLDAYLSALTPPFHGAVDVGVVSENGVERVEGVMVANNAIMNDLNAMARAYDERVGGAHAGAQIGPVGSSQPSTLVWVGAGLLAIAAIGGAVWWFSKKGRR